MVSRTVQRNVSPTKALGWCFQRRPFTLVFLDAQAFMLHSLELVQSLCTRLFRVNVSQASALFELFAPDPSRLTFPVASLFGSDSLCGSDLEVFLPLFLRTYFLFPL